MMKPLAHALAALGLAGAAISPVMATEAERMTVKVNLADLDLATAEGQRELDQRLKRAVRTVCRTKDLTTGSRILSEDARDCIAKARTGVKQQMAALSINQQRGG